MQTAKCNGYVITGTIELRVFHFRSVRRRAKSIELKVLFLGFCWVLGSDFVSHDVLTHREPKHSINSTIRTRYLINVVMFDAKHCTAPTSGGNISSFPAASAARTRCAAIDSRNGVRRTATIQYGDRMAATTATAAVQNTTTFFSGQHNTDLESAWVNTLASNFPRGSPFNATAEGTQHHEKPLVWFPVEIPRRNPSHRTQVLPTEELRLFSRKTIFGRSVDRLKTESSRTKTKWWCDDGAIIPIKFRSRWFRLAPK